MVSMLRNIQGAAARWVVPLLTGFTACAVYFLPGAADLFQYDRDRIAGGEIWRLVTSHWTHWSAEHLFWDLVLFLVLITWSMYINSRRTGIVIGLSSLIIPIGIYWIQPELVFYRGLSGLDSALFVFLTMQLFPELKRQKDRAGLLLLMVLLTGLCLKIVYETVTGQAIFIANMAPDVVVVPLAHIIGAGLGFILGIRVSGKAGSKPMPQIPFGPGKEVIL